MFLVSVAHENPLIARELLRGILRQPRGSKLQVGDQDFARFWMPRYKDSKELRAQVAAPSTLILG